MVLNVWFLGGVAKNRVVEDDVQPLLRCDSEIGLEKNNIVLQRKQKEGCYREAVLPE